MLRRGRLFSKAYEDLIVKSSELLVSRRRVRSSHVDQLLLVCGILVSNQEMAGTDESYTGCGQPLGA